VTVLEPRLIQAVLRQYPLHLRGPHGLAHWVRVRENGLRLAELTGAREDVVELFALFHDARRINEGIDPDHGARGGELARDYQGVWFDLDDEGLELLALACRDHSKGTTQGDLTVQTCWDADRLDLFRVGIRPRPDRLCTEAARDPRLIEWAVARSEAPFPEQARTWAEAAGVPLTR
jgi:uncharacterized protein